MTKWRNQKKPKFQLFWRNWGLSVFDYHLDFSIKFFASSIHKQRSKTNRSELSYTVVWGLPLSLERFMYFKQTWSSSPLWVSSTSSKYVRPLVRSIKSWCNFSTLVPKKKYQIYRKDDSGDVKIGISQPFSRENRPWTKIHIFFFFLATSIFFCFSRLNTKHKLVKNPDSNATLIQPMPPAPRSI